MDPPSKRKPIISITPLCLHGHPYYTTPGMSMVSLVAQQKHKTTPLEMSRKRWAFNAGNGGQFSIPMTEEFQFRKGIQLDCLQPIPSQKEMLMPDPNHVNPWYLSDCAMEIRKPYPTPSVFPYNDYMRLDETGEPELSPETMLGNHENWKKFCDTSTYTDHYRNNPDAVKEYWDRFYAQKEDSHNKWMDDRKEYLVSQFHYLAGDGECGSCPSPSRCSTALPDENARRRYESAMCKDEEESELPNGLYFYRQPLNRSPLSELYGLAEEAHTIVRRTAANSYYHPFLQADFPKVETPEKAWNRRVRFKYKTYNPGLDKSLEHPRSRSQCMVRELPKLHFQGKNKSHLHNEYNNRYQDQVPDIRDNRIWMRKNCHNRVYIE